MPPAAPAVARPSCCPPPLQPLSPPCHPVGVMVSLRHPHQDPPIVQPQPPGWQYTLHPVQPPPARAPRLREQRGAGGAEHNPLVVEDDVRPPDVAAGDADAVDAVVGVLVPGEVGVQPGLADPQVGGEDLVPLVLPRGEGGCGGRTPVLPAAPLSPQLGGLCEGRQGLSCLRGGRAGFGRLARSELVSSGPSPF